MTKTNENRRKLHATQLVKQMSKREESDAGKSNLVEQYQVIREDLLKLGKDLNRGYDIAKAAVEKKTILSELMKIRESF